MKLINCFIAILLLLTTSTYLDAQNPSVLTDAADFPAGSLSLDYYFTRLNNKVLFRARSGEVGLELFAYDINANSISLVKDINTGSSFQGDSHPSEFTVMDSILYLSAIEEDGEKELWRSNGTTSGTYRVKDFTYNNFGAEPKFLTAINSNLFFAASDSTGYELWKTDGTANGTVLVKDINAGLNHGINYNSAMGFEAAGNTLYFLADDGTAGEELWKSDGTTSGTVLVKDINPGSGNSDVDSVEVIGNTIYFAADDGVNGKELWKSDGTTSGTVLVKDINPGSAGADISDFVQINGTLYFLADDGNNNKSLWKSDGTTSGTVKVSGTPSSGINESSSKPDLVILGSDIFFVSNTDVLWKSDGTASGTSIVKDISVPGASYARYNLQQITINNTLYFTASDSLSKNYELWKSDGTTSGTVLVKDINPNGSAVQTTLHKSGNTLYFTANDGTNGYELWKSDGTTSGTSLIKDIYQGGLTHWSYNQLQYSEVVDLGNGMVLFEAIDTLHGIELWTTDGTTANTSIVADLNQSTDDIYGISVNFTPFQNDLYFLSSVGNDTRNNTGLWKTDGTSGGTNKVKSILARLSGFEELNSKLLFTVRKTTDDHLWFTDGTAAGTDTLNNNIDVYALGLEMNNTHYFTAEESTNGRELWKTDGTKSGTVLVKDINPSGSSTPSAFATMNNTLYFAANDGTNSKELWKSDGTASGTVLVKDINPGNSTSDIRNIVPVGNTLFFSANDGTNGKELWKSDGTASGTVLVKDIYSSGNALSSNFYATALNNKLYFRANSGNNRYSLWESDGTSGGTVEVKDLKTFAPFVHSGSSIYFVASDSTNNYNNLELWKSDGTTNGTVLVKDINGTNTSSSVGPIVSGVNNVYLVAKDSSDTRGLYKTDGSTANTELLFAFDGVTVPFTTIANLYYYDQKLFFTANHPDYGEEVWVYNIDSSTININRVQEDYHFANLYPNPNNGEFTIDIKEIVNLDLQITNTSGQIVKTATIRNRQNYAVDMSDVPAGVYFVSLTNKARRQLIKFIKK